MKKIVCLVFCFVLFTLPVWAAEEADFEEQLKVSGAQELPEMLPDGAQSLLDQAGVGDMGTEMLSGFTVDSALSAILRQAERESAGPLRTFGIVLGILLFTMLVDATKDSLSGNALKGTYSAVSALAVMTAVALPVAACIDRAGTIIEGAFVFMSAFIPVYAGAVIAAGQPLTGASYSAVMFGISELISGGAGMVAIPVVKSTLALSAVSALSARVKLSGLVDTIHKLVKWALAFLMTVFAGVLGLNGALSGAGDTVTLKSTRFVIGNFVPVVGGALSDAYSSVLGCLKLLKTSVGAFGMLAAFATFLPVILEAVLWLLCLHVCAGIGGMFGNKTVESVMKGVCAVVEILLALLMCCLAVLIASTGMILLSGGGSAA